MICLNEKYCKEYDDVVIGLSKTGKSYSIKIKEDSKTVAQLYAQAKSETLLFLHSLFVEQTHRSAFLGIRLMELVVDNFGHFDLKLSVYPKRENNMTDEDIQKRKKQLIKFYAYFGFYGKGESGTLHRLAKRTDEIGELFE